MGCIRDRCHRVATIQKQLQTSWCHLGETNSQNLIIQHAHAVQLHSGVNATFTTLRQQYWIPSTRQWIRSIIHRCVVCKKTSGKPYSKPDPPPLVKSQISQSNPFAVTGVDFTGTLYFRTTESERKVYLCLFTCAVTHALHLEVVTNLTVEYFRPHHPIVRQCIDLLGGGRGT